MIYLQNSACPDGYSCNVYSSLSGTPAQCKPDTPDAEPKSLVGEYCQVDSDCYSNIGYVNANCFNRECTGFVGQGLACESSSDCDPHLYCSHSTSRCVPLLLIGDSCTETTDCEMDAFCLGSSEDDSNTTCIAYYSLKGGRYCMYSDQCKSGFCDQNQNLCSYDTP
jgi:hypothetical protein